MITLLDRGANINEKNNYGRTVLHYAVAYGSNKCISTLLNWNADVYAKNDYGATPLDVANYGATPLDVANDEIKRLIEEYQDFPTIKEPDSN